MRVSKHPLYSIWAGMKSRCYSERDPKYCHYGQRGIEICERWKTFEFFCQDMGERPSLNHSIDRIDVNKGYSPENCRWSTVAQQNANKQYHRKTEDGRLLRDVCSELNIEPRSVYKRIALGWSEYDAIYTPILKKGQVRRHRNAVKTHCINGHAFTVENTIARKGGRACRACKRMIDNARYAANK